MIPDGLVHLSTTEWRCEMGPFTIPVIIALIATVVVLFVGIISMARGGEFDRQHSAQLMFTRVWFQAAVVILIIAAVLYAARVS